MRHRIGTALRTLANRIDPRGPHAVTVKLTPGSIARYRTGIGS